MDSDVLVRLERLEAIEAIRQLKARYFRAADGKDPEAMRACFAPGQIDLRYGRIGNFTDRDTLVDIFARLACEEHIVEMHHGQNPIIEVYSSETASGTWGLYYYLVDTQRQIVTQLGGSYSDTYRRVDGEWLMTASSFEVSSTQILDLSAEGVAAIFAGRTAPADLDDPEAQAAAT